MRWPRDAAHSCRRGIVKREVETDMGKGREGRRPRQMGSRGTVPWWLVVMLVVLVVLACLS